jgi:hypothetical protein
MSGLSRSIIGAAVAVSALFWSVGVTAQRTGTRLGKDAAKEDAAAAMQLLADCTVTRRPDLVEKWFRTLPGTPRERELLHKASEDLSACFDSDMLVMDGKELAFKPRVMRYPVAAAWVRRHMAKSPIEAPEAADPDPWFVTELNALPADAPVDRANLMLQDFGHCVSLREWGGTRALLLSKPGSSEQKAAVEKLVPVLGDCLSQDAKITLNPDNLRKVMAEPVYHIVTAAAAKR